MQIIYSSTPADLLLMPASETTRIGPIPWSEIEVTRGMDFPEKHEAPQIIQLPALYARLRSANGKPLIRYLTPTHALCSTPSQRFEEVHR